MDANTSMGSSDRSSRPRKVELDALSDRARNNYLYARALVGRVYASPASLCAICADALHRTA
jgi:hypothetical protein